MGASWLLPEAHTPCCGAGKQVANSVDCLVAVIVPDMRYECCDQAICVGEGIQGEVEMWHSPYWAKGKPEYYVLVSKCNAPRGGRPAHRAGDTYQYQPQRGVLCRPLTVLRAAPCWCLGWAAALLVRPSSPRAIASLSSPHAPCARLARLGICRRRSALAPSQRTRRTCLVLAKSCVFARPCATSATAVTTTPWLATRRCCTRTGFRTHASALGAPRFGGVALAY